MRTPVQEIAPSPFDDCIGFGLVNTLVVLVIRVLVEVFR